MNSTRVVVIDVSQSMRSGFQSDRQGPSARPTLANTKFAAALEYLWYVIDNADRDSELLLLSFGLAATQLYSGPIRNRAAINAALVDVRPNEPKTNLEVAFDKISTRMSSERNAGVDTIGVVDVITDGLVNVGDPVSSARHIQSLGAFITIYLIDDTSEGLHQARDIVGRQGRVEPVRTLAGFRDQYERQIPAREHALESSLRSLENYDRARMSFMRTAESLQRPFCTAAYPTALPPKMWASLELFLYARQLRESVEREIRRIRTEQSFEYATATSELDVALPVGSRVTATLESESFDINPNEVTIRWLEEFYRLPFRVRARDDARTNNPTIDVRLFVDDLPVGAVNIRITITSDRHGQSGQQTAALRWFSDVFASYAREDLAIVEHLRSRYAALGVFLFIDVDDLRAGAMWRPDLMRRIESSDLFQLFWSQAAASSNVVQDEWRHALAQVQAKGSGFIRPLYWQDPMPTIPLELSAINFRRITFIAAASQT